MLASFFRLRSRTECVRDLNLSLRPQEAQTLCEILYNINVLSFRFFFIRYNSTVQRVLQIFILKVFPNSQIHIN